MNLLTKLFGSYSKKELKRIEPLKQAVLALDDKYTKMTDEELKGQTAVLKERLSLGSSLDDILPEAFATCREAMWRVLSIKPFPVQIIGGIILHQGRIAEMKTGEGKTFTAALPAYLNALSGKGVHIVTVNDYLAKYQGEMMARVFNYLGLTVGLAIPGMEPDEKKKPTPATSHTQRTMRSALTTCVTTWSPTRSARCSAATTSPSWTKWTPSSSTKPARR